MGQTFCRVANVLFVREFMLGLEGGNWVCTRKYTKEYFSTKTKSPEVRINGSFIGNDLCYLFIVN